MNKEKRRPYREQSSGEMLDLDDTSLYKDLPNTCRELEDMVFRTYGYATAYFKYHSQYSNLYKSQQGHLEVMMEVFFKEHLEHYRNKNVQWFKEMVFLIDDLCENLC